MVGTGHGAAVQAGFAPILEALGRLRTELIEAAWALDTRGQHQAADMAMSTSARLAELCEEYVRTAGIGETSSGTVRTVARTGERVGPGLP